MKPFAQKLKNIQILRYSSWNIRNYETSFRNLKYSTEQKGVYLKTTYAKSIRD
ncbi:hypothetical protein G436_3199 [Leptospira interrogans serovar Hardjo str. Norma]|uniref:Uncharacterized protein n=1 Tax=Leptospira interrogans serovar Hardjo str. Norma TaxID=1279460 RepID=A0A0M4N778_LEPIR|nr:hypothetical protein G436_3199 [Leptospira interrogans serovar Hardjo str. Norma]